MAQRVVAGRPCARCAVAAAVSSSDDVAKTTGSAAVPLPRGRAAVGGVSRAIKVQSTRSFAMAAHLSLSAACNVGRQRPHRSTQYVAPAHPGPRGGQHARPPWKGGTRRRPRVRTQGPRTALCVASTLRRRPTPRACSGSSIHHEPTRARCAAAPPPPSAPAPCTARPSAPWRRTHATVAPAAAAAAAGGGGEAGVLPAALLAVARRMMNIYSSRAL
jgi:hypothetical protein